MPVNPIGPNEDLSQTPVAKRAAEASSERLERPEEQQRSQSRTAQVRNSSQQQPDRSQPVDRVEIQQQQTNTVQQQQDDDDPNREAPQPIKPTKGAINLTA